MVKSLKSRSTNLSNAAEEIRTAVEGSADDSCIFAQKSGNFARGSVDEELSAMPAAVLVKECHTTGTETASRCYFATHCIL